MEVGLTSSSGQRRTHTYPTLLFSREGAAPLEPPAGEIVKKTLVYGETLCFTISPVGGPGGAAVPLVKQIVVYFYAKA